MQDSYGGTMQIKGEKYLVKFQEQEIGCDGVTLWNYQSESNEVSLSPFDEEEEVLFHPTMMLKNWKEEYKPKFIRQDTENENITTIIDLTPTARKSYFKVRLIIKKEKNELLRIHIYEKDGTVFTYKIDQFQSNVTLNDDLFIFNEANYPDVLINDMR